MKQVSMVLMIGLMLLGAAGRGDLARAQEKAKASTPPRAALKGLDPVEFVAGKAVQGKPTISADYHQFRYVFANQQNKALFSKDPERYGIQGDGTCPVAPKFKVDPDLVMLYKGRIYAFATLPCMGLFGKDPEKYLTKWPGSPTHQKKNG